MKRWALILIVVLVACGRSAPAPAPAPPAPTPAPPPAPQPPPPSLDAVRALKTTQPAEYEHDLKLLTESSDVKTRGRAEALLALFYLDQNRHADAVPYLERAAQDDLWLAPSMWLRIDTPEMVMRTIQIGAESFASTLARIRITGIYAEQKNVDAANLAFQYTSGIPIDESTEREFMRLQRTLTTERPDLAVRLSMRFLNDDVHGNYTEENYAYLAKLTPSPLDALTRDQVIDLAKKLGSADHYDEVLDLLNRFAKRDPAQAATPEFRDVQLHALFSSRHYTELLTELGDKSLRDPALLLLRARAEWRLNRNDEMLADLKRIERLAPHSAEATEVKVIRAKYYTIDDPKLDLAIANLRELVNAGTLGTEGEHLWTLGWTQLLAHQDEDALRTFAEYKTRFPDGDYLMNALFWTGKIDDRLGHAADRDKAWDELEATYPYNYFSYRARELRHQPMVAPSEIANGNIFPNLDAELATARPTGQDTFDQIAEFESVGLYREALPDFKDLLQAYNDNPAVVMMMADAYVNCGEPALANALLQRKFRVFIRHGGSGVPHHFWELLYPLAYWDIIQTQAAKQNVDPYLLAAIARQESLFDPNTVSSAGAVGVMQIMPQEAARIATAAGLQPPTREQLFDPAVNIAIGAAEYAQKRAAMNGNDILAIAAYNAGTEAVGKWLAQTPVDDGDLFVEAIPYNETRLYVKTVTRNRFEYRRIYENGGSTSQQQK